jgi:hypothetical protein
MIKVIHVLMFCCAAVSALGTIDLYLDRNFQPSLTPPSCGNVSFPCTNISYVIDTIASQPANNFQVHIAANNYHELCGLALSNIAGFVEFNGVGNVTFSGCSSSNSSGLTLSSGPSYRFNSIQFQGRSTYAPLVYATGIINTTVVSLQLCNVINGVYSVFVLENGAMINLIDSTFQNIYAPTMHGAALRLNGSSGISTNSSFLNVSASYGGAVYVDGANSQLNFVNCQCTMVSATKGGCIAAANGASITISNSNVTSASALIGGVVHLENNSIVVVQDSAFWMCGYSNGSIASSFSSSLSLFRCSSFHGLNDHGFLYSISSNLTLDQCYFFNNSGSGYSYGSGALYTQYSQINFANSLFLQNTGGSYPYTLNLNSTGTITNCTFHTSTFLQVMSQSSINFVNCKFQNLPIRSITGSLITFDGCNWYNSSTSWIELDTATILLFRSTVFNVSRSFIQITYATSGTLIVKELQFHKNFGLYGSLIGGGSGNVQVTIQDSSFSDNHAEIGGLIHLDSSTSNVSLAFFNNSVFGTTAVQTGGVFYVKSASIQISNCIFSNQMAGAGGFAYVQTGFQTGNFQISSSVITRSTAYVTGGAFHIARFGSFQLNPVKLILINVSVSTGRAGNKGGAIYFESSTAGDIGLYNVSFWNNSALWNGGAIFVEDLTNLSLSLNLVSFDSNFVSYDLKGCNSTVGSGGAFYLANCSFLQSSNLFNVSQTTLSNNFASRYGGAFGFPGGPFCSTTAAEALMSKFILMNNSGPYGPNYGTNMMTVQVSVRNDTEVGLVLPGVRPFLPLQISGNDSFANQVIGDVCAFQIGYSNITGYSGLYSNLTNVILPVNISDLQVFNPMVQNSLCGKNFTYSLVSNSLSLSYSGSSILIYCNSILEELLWEANVLQISTVVVSATIGVGVTLVLISVVTESVTAVGSSGIVAGTGSGLTTVPDFAASQGQSATSHLGDVLDFCHSTVVLGFIAAENRSEIFNGCLKAFSWTFGTIPSIITSSKFQGRKLLDSVDTSYYGLNSFQKYARIIGFAADEIFLSVLFVFSLCWIAGVLVFIILRVTLELKNIHSAMANMVELRLKLKWAFYGAHVRLSFMFFSSMSLTSAYELTMLDKGFVDFLAGCALTGCAIYLLLGSIWAFRLSPQVATEPKTQLIFGS